MTFINLGQFHLSANGQTGHEQMIPLPDAAGVIRPWLEWGYTKQDNPGAGAWIETGDLREMGVPENATAVRLHIKAKAKTIKWTPIDSLADIQVLVKAVDSPAVTNECIHATACQKGGTDLPGEQISHGQIDVAIGESGKVALYHYPSFTGYSNIDLVVYLAGYWAPIEAPEAPDNSMAARELISASFLQLMAGLAALYGDPPAEELPVGGE